MSRINGGARRRRGGRHRAGFGGLLALAAAGGAGAVARADDGFGGTWTASPLSERWAVGDWGEACGPKPVARGAPGAQVQVIEHGGELAFSGGGYPRTSACYEAGLAVRVRAHTAGPRAWRTECSSDPNDSRQAHLVTTVSSPNDGTLVFDETGEYQFLIKGQNCTASVRRGRTYTRARAAEAAPPPPSAPPPPAAPPPPEPAAPAPARCERPGEPAKLEVRPQRKLLRPGQSFAFRTTVLDAADCRVQQGPAWSVVQGAEGVAVSAAGNVTVPPGTPEGEIVLQASVGAQAVRVTVEVAGDGRYAELLADRKGGWAETGEKGEVAEVALSTPRIGTVTVVAPDERGSRRALFLAVVAASATVLAAVGLVLRRRRGEAGAARGPAPSPRATGGDDGARATPAREAPPGAATPPRDAKVCPVCGRRYAADALFCGQEGAALVAVNRRLPFGDGRAATPPPRPKRPPPAPLRPGARAAGPVALAARAGVLARRPRRARRRGAAGASSEPFGGGGPRRAHSPTRLALRGGRRGRRPDERPSPRNPSGARRRASCAAARVATPTGTTMHRRRVVGTRAEGA